MLKVGADKLFGKTEGSPPKSCNLIAFSLQNIASDARKHREKKIKQLLEKRKIPDSGFDDLTIELLINEISQLDSNNFVAKCGVGEREARVACGKTKHIA